MDGFVLTIGSRCPDRAFDNYSPPGYPDKSLVRVAMGDGASFAYWGETLGDACYASGANNSLLILSGYITDGVVVDNFRSQQKVAESLLEHIDQHPSLERIRKLPDKLYGAFSIIYVDGEGQSAYIITDRVAARPVWVKSLKNLHIISSHTMAAAWFSNDLEYDLGGLASLLLYRCQVEPTKCLYRGINAVPEGTVASISTPSGMKNYRWYRFKHSPDEKTSYKGWLDLASQSLCRGAERILKTSENPLVFLSGGIDSRLTASALRAAGGKPLLATLGDTENNEVKVARKVAASLECDRVARSSLVSTDPAEGCI